MAALIWDLAHRPETRRFSKGNRNRSPDGIKRTPLVLILSAVLTGGSTGVRRAWWRRQLRLRVVSDSCILPRDSKGLVAKGMLISDGRIGSSAGPATSRSGRSSPGRTVLDSGDQFPWVLLRHGWNRGRPAGGGQLDRPASHARPGGRPWSGVTRRSGGTTTGSGWCRALMVAGHYAISGLQAGRRPAALWCSGRSSRAC